MRILLVYIRPPCSPAVEDISLQSFSNWIPHWSASPAMWLWLWSFSHSSYLHWSNYDQSLGCLLASEADLMERLGQTMLTLLSLAQVIHQEATELLLVSILTKSIARKQLLIDDFSQEMLRSCFITPSAKTVWSCEDTPNSIEKNRFYGNWLCCKLHQTIVVCDRWDLTCFYLFSIQRDEHVRNHSWQASLPTVPPGLK